MKKLMGIFLGLLLAQAGIAQTIDKKLAQAVAQLEADPQLRHALLGLYVVDAATGKPVYAHHEQVGLAAASTQKIFTSVAAFELLGNNYQYKTVVGYDGKLEAGVLNGNLHIDGYGDPTLGSWRWDSTKPEVVLKKIVGMLQQRGIKNITGHLYINDSAFALQPIPGGWIWDDIGNYYGAGCWGMNWRENQYDLVIEPGAKEGSATRIVATKPALAAQNLLNQITTGNRGSGDNAYIYLPPYSGTGFTQGTIPLGEPFTISGALPQPSVLFTNELLAALTNAGIVLAGSPEWYFDKKSTNRIWPAMEQTIGTILSPTLDSINYWFLRRSINLYGEALAKTIALKKTGIGATETGVELIRDFWNEAGIEKSAVNMMDGSGLSPQNRVTTHGLVKVLQYAKTKTWYPSFYKAMPEYNGMKMKSGSIGGARAFAGYHTAKNGKAFVYAIIVNNYDGSSGEAVKKLYKILDVLK